MKPTTIGHVIDHLDHTFPPKYQEDYDNSGFLLGDPTTQYRGTLIAIDLTPQTIGEAIAHNLNLIVTHHPFIFSGLKRITTQTETGRMTIQLIQNNIAVYAAHTNLDNMKNGVNGILAQKLGLTNCHILKPMADNPDLGAGMLGQLPEPMPVADFLNQVKQRLRLPVVRCSNLCRTTIQTVAICGGSGSFLITNAITAHADILLTADLKYHDFQKAEERIILADIGHYESEQFAKEVIYCAISEKFRNFAYRISSAQNGYVHYI
ncbi:MAG: Nif3-like dinuclear metal center hexameric protein [Bacteroidales bacterium]|nr:Nif3-like dinuclear metal center hexameric protein [Bacteroidales bacterium]